MPKKAVVLLPNGMRVEATPEAVQVCEKAVRNAQIDNINKPDPALMTEDEIAGWLKLFGEVPVGKKDVNGRLYPGG